MNSAVRAVLDGLPDQPRFVFVAMCAGVRQQDIAACLDMDNNAIMKLRRQATDQLEFQSNEVVAYIRSLSRWEQQELMGPLGSLLDNPENVIGDGTHGWVS